MMSGVLTLVILKPGFTPDSGGPQTPTEYTVFYEIIAILSFFDKGCHLKTMWTVRNNLCIYIKGIVRHISKAPLAWLSIVLRRNIPFY
jgi:hypothetical protein